MLPKYKQRLSRILHYIFHYVNIKRDYYIFNYIDVKRESIVKCCPNTNRDFREYYIIFFTMLMLKEIITFLIILTLKGIAIVKCCPNTNRNFREDRL